MSLSSATALAWRVFSLKSCGARTMSTRASSMLDSMARRSAITVSGLLHSRAQSSAVRPFSSRTNSVDEYSWPCSISSSRPGSSSVAARISGVIESKPPTAVSVGTTGPGAGVRLRLPKLLAVPTLLLRDATDDDDASPPPPPPSMAAAAGWGQVAGLAAGGRPTPCLRRALARAGFGGGELLCGLSASTTPGDAWRAGSRNLRRQGLVAGSLEAVSRPPRLGPRFALDRGGGSSIQNDFRGN